MNIEKIDKNDFVRASVHTKVTTGEALAMLRHLQGLSQSELAELTGMSQPNISAIERDRASMGRETALTLAYVLKVHPGVLLFPDFDIKSVA